ncbi:MAG TPA: sigma-54 dependent transcriptional regulator [Kofleriaceae bacterium]|nr:sigma-54 dependent transcriptional regulator [Kofleriaceae bacterium]
MDHAGAAARPAAIVVDDHQAMARLVAENLERDGWHVRALDSGRAALAAMAESAPSLVVTDLRMPDVDGLAVLAAAPRDTAVIVMTAFGDVEAAVEAMRRGAWDFVEKPVRMAELVAHAARARARLREHALAGIIGASAPMQQLARAASRVAPTGAAVLIRGESGTGKELVARAIHAASARRDHPFVAINCAGLADGVIESELFGHVRGAFTGAASSRLGVFGEADGGTLFLDEIGDMPIAVQAKLLRVLQEQEVRAVGSDATRKVDVRVIAATHRDLEAEIRAGRFREDLFYRLAVVPITVPPLRDRRDDIALLADHFLTRARERNTSAVRELSSDVIASLVSNVWPGNVRELEHVIERLAILGRGHAATLDDLRAICPEVCDRAARPAVPTDELVTLREVEDAYIDRVLAYCGANKVKAAEILGIDLSTLYRRTRARTSERLEVFEHGGAIGRR